MEGKSMGIDKLVMQDRDGISTFTSNATQALYENVRISIVNEIWHFSYIGGLP